MPDETDTQVEARESAIWQGRVSGIIKGVLANWREILIAAGLAMAAWNHFDVQSAHEKERQIDKHLENTDRQVVQLATNNIE